VTPALASSSEARRASEDLMARVVCQQALIDSARGRQEVGWEKRESVKRAQRGFSTEGLGQPP
jgi:hypothetical protein